MKITLKLAASLINNPWLIFNYRFTSSIIKAVSRVSGLIETSAKAAVESSGLKGSLTQGLQATVIQGNGFNAEIQLQSDIPFFSVFSKGVTIKGNPFLWLPLSFGDAAGRRVSEFSGQLFMVHRKVGGPPLLLSIQTKKPMFVGLSSVTLKKRIDLSQVTEGVMRGFGGMIKDELG